MATCGDWPDELRALGVSADMLAVERMRNAG